MTTVSNDWTLTALGLTALEDAARQKLAQLQPIVLRRDTVLFRPGDSVTGFVMVLSGRVGVYLTGANGREMLLYAVTPGETCVQTTIGLLGEELYSGEAIAETDLSAVMVPKPVFLDLMATSPGFRAFVFHAFAERLNAVMKVLEQVAFVAVETRLVRRLLDVARDGYVAATHQELATAIGTSREVVSRSLERLDKLGFIARDRGGVHLRDAAGLAARLIE